MKKRAFLVMNLFLAQASCATEWNFAENLLVEPPPQEEYDIYVKSEDGWNSTLWQSKTNGSADTFTVNVFSDMEMSPQDYREIQDKPGREACEKFETTVTDRSKVNGYSSLIWETTCEIGNVKIRILQKAIAGKDSFYHIRKSWKKPVSELHIKHWEQRIIEVNVCDTRGDESPCPSGYTKVEDDHAN